jgi:hypothetical protein
MERSLYKILFGCVLGGVSLLGSLSETSAQTPPTAAPVKPQSYTTNSLPNGSFLRCWTSMQATRAAADEFVLYKCEWQLNGTLPTQSGFSHLERIARRIQSTSFCVVIQPDNNVELNDERRAQVVHFLRSRGVADAVHRVTLAHPEAEGLTGDDAERIFMQHPQGSH